MEQKKVIMYFVRHGETYLNKYKRMQGWSDAPLTAQGEAVAGQTGEILKDIKFDAVYTSDLGRTIRTAKIIMKNNRYKEDVSFISTSSFRESFFGYYEGALQQDAYAAFAEHAGMKPENLFRETTLPEFMQNIKDTDPFHEAENYTELWERLWKGLDEVVKNAGDTGETKVLICTHGNVIRNIFTKMDERISPAEEVKNAGISILEYQNGKYKVTAYNQNCD